MKHFLTRKTRTFSLLCSALVFVAAGSAGSAGADEKDDWLIGKIFMSRADRVMLDNLRNAPQAAATVSTNANATVATSAPPKKKTNPTGYILSSNGSPYRWENGHFRKTASASIAISGSVDKIDIVKHQQSNASDASHDVDRTEPDQSGDCDVDRTSDHDSEC